MIQDAHLDRLDGLLDDRDLEAVWFARPNDFTWLTGGRNVVDREASVGVAAAGYDGTELTVLTDSIEAERIGDEEIPNAVTVREFPWYEGDLASAVAERTATPAGADFAVPDPAVECVDFGSIRCPLTEADRERYRDLGRDTAAAVETVATERRTSATERAVAADLRGELASRGIEAPVVLVGGAERAPRYRHYTPTDASLGAYALLSVTGVRNGLHASCTRTIAFDAPDWLTERHEAAMVVEASALAATKRVAGAGGTASDVFETIRAAYSEVGYAGEWRKHHQGGATGYAGREWFGTPESDAPVDTPMAYAWNPTVQGAKSEDTALLTAEGIEGCTTTGDWPTTEVEALDGTTVERHAVLER